DPAVPLAAIQRRRGLHRHQRRVCEARGHHPLLRGAARRKARSAARAGVLHGRRHRGRGGEVQDDGCLTTTMPLALEIVTPEERVVTVTCDEVRLTSVEGQFGIRPGHTPLVAALAAGELVYIAGGATHRYAAGEGFA